MERWTQEEEKYLVNNYKTTMYSDIAKILNKSEGAIRAKCFELNLVKNNAWTQDEIDFIKSNYQKLSIKQMAEILNRTENAVKIKANRNGCKRSPYFCHYDFFRTIDTEEKAYWYGFIAADGWITVNQNTNSGHVGIELQYSDINHLKKFNKSIGGNYKITTRDRQCKISTYPEHVNKMCNIRVFSIGMVNDLINLGITIDKTYKFALPALETQLMRHFIRGYFDGDGCVRIKSRKLASGDITEYPLCDFSSVNRDFLEQLRTFLYESIGICSYIYVEKNNLCRLCVHKNEHTLALLNYMYQDSSVCLDRKYNMYMSIIKNNATNDGLAV